jgi:hypothetical protein
MPSYRYEGIEAVEGVPCHRLEFDPLPQESAADGVAGKISQATAGTLWVTEQGLHVIRAESRSTRPVPVALSLAKVESLNIQLENHEVAPGVWLPRRIEVRSRGRILLSRFNKRNVFLYSEFEPVVEISTP